MKYLLGSALCFATLLGCTQGNTFSHAQQKEAILEFQTGESPYACTFHDSGNYLVNKIPYVTTPVKIGDYNNDGTMEDLIKYKKDGLQRYVVCRYKK